MGDKFGWSVAIYDTRVIVDSYEDHDFGSYFGSAYVFDLNTAKKYLVSNSETTPERWLVYDYFGFAVAIYDTRAIVGSLPGSAYVFDLNMTKNTWSQTTKLLPSDGSVGDMFGWSVAIYDSRAIVGSYYDDLATNTWT